MQDGGMNMVSWLCAAGAVILWSSFAALVSHAPDVPPLLLTGVAPASGSVICLRGADCVAKMAGAMVDFGGCIDAIGSVSGGLAFSLAHAVVYAMASVVRFAEIARSRGR